MRFASAHRKPASTIMQPKHTIKSSLAVSRGVSAVTWLCGQALRLKTLFWNHRGAVVAHVLSTTSHEEPLEHSAWKQK